MHALREARTWTVGEGEVGERLDRFVTDALEGASRSQVSHAVADGRVLVNDAPPGKAGLKLALGDVVRWIPPATMPGDPPIAEDIAVQVVYEDAALAVVNKPAGLVVHPAAGHATGTLVNALMSRFGGLSTAGGDDRPGIVHRLDKDTSGLLVVARRDDVHRALAALFERHVIRRRYVAVVLGPRLADAGTVETMYARSRRDRRRMTGQGSDGRRARTHWRVLARSEAMALVMLQLDTGRTHQIRVHMSEHGHPVVADELYGRKPAKGGAGRVAVELAAARRMPRQALHAALLGFEHPDTGEALSFTAPLPADMAALVGDVFGEEWVEAAIEATGATRPG